MSRSNRVSAPATFEEWLKVYAPSPNEYTAIHPTISNSIDDRDTAGFGGLTFAFAIKVGHMSVPDTYRLYSCVGHFLTLARAGLPLSATVTNVRDEKAFVTRRIDVFQIFSVSGKPETKQPIAAMQLDFHLPEPATLLTYSAAPFQSYTPPSEALTEPQMRAHAKNKGIKESMLKIVDSAMLARKHYFELRSPPESFMADTLHGWFPALDETQKDKSITERIGAYYWRCLEKLENPAANAAAVGFLCDAGMPVTPPAFADLDYTKIGKMLSLDFAFRVFVNDINASNWLLREERTVAGGEGRTFTECRIFDQSGRIVASMSQQCLLRPRRSSTGSHKL